MAWLQSHQSLRDHPKKDRLAELLFDGSVSNDVSELAAVGLLHCLWWWALDYAQDGDLSKFSDRQIAKGCGWVGDSTLLVQALVEARFVDKKTGHIHDWDEYAGKLVERRERDRKRAKNWRASSSVCEANADATHSVQGRKTRVERKETHGRAHECAVPPVVSYCPKDGATLQPDGHCPVCEVAS
jgi:hypothetical protein